MKLLLAIMFTIFGVFYYPYVLLYGWDSFVVPLGVSSMSYWYMFGLAGLVALMTKATTVHLAKEPDLDKNYCAKIAGTNVGIAIAHLIFWLIAG